MKYFKTAPDLSEHSDNLKCARSS